jgi:hypothetical protein
MRWPGAESPSVGQDQRGLDSGGSQKESFILEEEELEQEGSCLSDLGGTVWVVAQEDHGLFFKKSAGCIFVFKDLRSQRCWSELLGGQLFVDEGG